MRGLRFSSRFSFFEQTHPFPYVEFCKLPLSITIVWYSSKETQQNTSIPKFPRTEDLFILKIDNNIIIKWIDIRWQTIICPQNIITPCLYEAICSLIPDEWTTDWMRGPICRQLKIWSNYRWVCAPQSPYTIPIPHNICLCVETNHGVQSTRPQKIHILSWNSSGLELNSSGLDDWCYMIRLQYSQVLYLKGFFIFFW